METQPVHFSEISVIFHKPSIDLFASRLNYQCFPYVSWKADPASVHTDAFTFDWSKYHCFYAFPPFSLINKMLTKIEHDQAFGILIAPLWHTQSWFPTMLKLIVRTPIILHNRQKTTNFFFPFSSLFRPFRTQ